jgi:hypothetical protein
MNVGTLLGLKFSRSISQGIPAAEDKQNSSLEKHGPTSEVYRPPA